MKSLFPPFLGMLFALCLAAAPAPPNYDESQVGNLPLPDPLVLEDGTRVRDVATWRERRRPELLELFAREVCGRTPAGRPPEMRWKVTSVDRAAFEGKATRREITGGLPDRPALKMKPKNGGAR